MCHQITAVANKGLKVTRKLNFVDMSPPLVCLKPNVSFVLLAVASTLLKAQSTVHVRTLSCGVYTLLSIMNVC